MAETKTIADQIAQIKTDRDKIRSAMQDMGLATSTDKLSTLATKLDAVLVFDGLEYSVKQGEPFSIPKGYHTGGTTVIGLDNPAIDAETYKRTSVTGVKPKKEKVTVQTPEGYYAMSSVSIDPIPDNYQDISSVTATQADVLPTKLFVTGQGELKYGTMQDNGAVSKTLDMSKNSSGQYSNNQYTIPKGYHNGSGKVNIAFESPITLTPDRSKHEYVPSAGKVLSTVTVQPIPSNLQDVSGVTATANTVLEGSSFVNTQGVKVDGTVPVHEDKQIILSLSKTHEDLSDKYYSTSTVSIITEGQREVTPDKTGCTISPTKDQYNRERVLSTVKVLPIPDKYQDVSGVTAVASNVLEDTFFVTKGGALTEGTMPSYGVVERTINWTDLSQAPYYEGTFQGYVTGVSVGVNTSTLEAALAEI